MGIIKRALKIFSGTAWDKYYPETSADQVKFTKTDGTESNVQTELAAQNSALENFIPVKIKTTQYIEKVTGGYIKIGKIVVFSISFTPKADIQNGVGEAMTGFPVGLCNGKFSDTTNVYYDGVDSRYIHITNGDISIKGPHSAGTEYHASGCYIAR